MFSILNDDLLKIIVSVVIGAIIGAEREYKSKAIGFRTIILITLGSCLITIVSTIMGKGKDDTRIAANIITGIGFLGAGAIFKEGATVKGVTTAATIWISAAIGMAIGIAQYEFAFLVATIVMTVLLGFTWFQNFIDKTNTNKVYKITLTGHSMAKLKELDDIIKGLRLKSNCTNHMKISNEMILTYSIRGAEKKHKELIKRLYETSLVESFEC